MRLGKSAVVGLGAVALSLSLLMSRPAASAAPTTRPANPDVREQGSQTTIRLFSPWSRLRSLTDEQRAKIADIHKKALAEIKAIQLKQEEDIKALLSDDQKKELRDQMEKEAADRKARAANRAAAVSEAPAPTDEKKNPATPDEPK